MPNLLVEIGTEELPVEALDVIYSELSKKVEEAFRKNRLGFKKNSVETTPRRISLFLENLAARQEDQTLEWTGPSQEKAYDGQGNPTPALEGFLKSKNAALRDVILKETPKGKFISLHKKENGKLAAAVLPVLLKDIFSGLAFAKTMRWERSGFRFPRPIRWLVALLDKQIIPVQLADVKSSARSFGHRFLAPKSFSISRADWKDYQKSLKRAHVILSREERKQIVRRALQVKFHQKSLDEDLVHTTDQLVEEPYFLTGTFSKTYLELPAEVLASCMKKNQKIFACYDAKGHLSHQFVAVLNGKRAGLGKIRAGYENVLESRLKDARYFYEADTKEPLEKKLPLLEQVTYLPKLGTMLDKTKRLEKLAENFAPMIGQPGIVNDLRRAARLSKIDLMTHLVYEFPDLQGIVGREYALESDEKEEVARAIGTQYLPKNLAEDYRNLTKQMSPLGALFGVLDRLDLLVGAFGTGLEPTGSQDPFALRRAGGALVKIVRGFGFHFSLTEAIEANASLYQNSFDIPKKDLVGKLLQFFQERTVFELQVKPGTRPREILLAVFRASFDDLADAYKRYEILVRLYEREPENFLKAAKVVERTANILKSGKEKTLSPVNPDLFQDPLERELFKLFCERSDEIATSVTRRDYEKATLLFGKVFYGPLHEFFDRVLVNAEDPAIRTNRHALMKQINGLYTERLADLSILSRLDQG